VVTDGAGRFLFASVQLGKYTIKVTLSSFEEKTVTDNLVEAEKTTNVPISLKLATLEVSTTVTGQTPVVDATNQTQQTRLRADEFQMMPYGRNYQTLIGQAPGVVGTGNVNAHGALTSNNQFLFDGVNTTDPTTGTFGSNLNFESIQEIVIRTSSVGVEFGRGTGAIVDVITKSGTNRPEGSFKYLMTNDDWNAIETTKSEVANADGSFTELKRTKFDKVNPVYSLTLGGPAIKNRLWGFMAYENAKNTTPQRNTTGKTAALNENYQQTTDSPFWLVRVTSQVAPNHNVWFKYHTSPTNGFVIDYWGRSAELFALTQQDQGNESWAGQWTSVLGSKWTAEVMAATAKEFINVVPYKASPLDNGAPYWDYTDNRYYNGATFDGYVKRPRTQASAAASYFTTLGGNTHNLKFGFDWQGMNSENSFRYPTNQFFTIANFQAATRAFTLETDISERDDFEDAPSKSDGNQTAFYVRDKFELGARVNLEAGVRIEKQTGKSDVGKTTVNATSVAPRFSGSYAVTSDGKTLVVGSFGRFHDGILQGFSDSFANVPQQTNYDAYIWNGSAFVFSSSSTSAANPFTPNEKITPRHLDEFTLGFERQLSNVVGIGVRFITRDWSNFVDDVITFNADGTRNRRVANIDSADRTYKGLELTAEKRFASNWTGSASYTYSQTRGNHFGNDFTALEDFKDATCRQTADSGLLGGGNFPCSEVASKLTGKPTFDRPHLLKMNGAYSRPFGPVNVTAGMVANFTSKTTYSKTRAGVQVLAPSGSPSGATFTYNYEGVGSERVPGLLSLIDLSLEASYRAYKRANFGMKFDTFNLFNNEEKVNVSNTTWCVGDSSPACTLARTNFGKATGRDRFTTPRTFRFTFLVRY
jgi:hypothetical protein